jgi:sigma-B regulation protein RsbU (phosphoserine phosphatase)
MIADDDSGGEMESRNNEMTSNTKALGDPYRGLVRVSCVINSIHDYTQLLTSLLQITKEVLNCDAGSLFLYEEVTNDLSWHVALGEKADKLKQMGRMKMGQGIAGWVAENRKSTLVADAYNDQRFFRGTDTKTGFQTRSIVCVPLLLGDKLVGVLQALNPLHKPFFDGNDLEVFEAYGAMAATALEKIRWQETTLQQQKMQQELEIAQEIQSRFLAQSFEEAEKNFQLALYSEPAFEIGGDFYDVQKTKNGAYAIILGDVTGKGVPAALLMAQLLSDFRYRAPNESDPGKILSQMNQTLSAHSARGMFATAWCAVVRPQGSCLVTQQASAGHLAPFWRSLKGIESVELSSGLPLGLMADCEFPSSEVILNHGDFLCVYTDGITEGRNVAGAEFGTQGMQDLLLTLNRNTSLAKDQLLKAVTDFGQGTSQRDDLTFLLCAPK